MCDTMIALGDVTASGRVIFGKNSDREPNEAQYLTQQAAADHAPGSMVECTYIAIPQAAHTYAVLGSRPWWMWGFEHGMNEKGLTIGNEAVWSRLPASDAPGLLGMDLLRLTLERAADADEAIAVLTDLLETYGQSGNASASRTMLYHNSFILADGTGGWVLQTAGKHWAEKRIRSWASISNVYSIADDYDRISAHAINSATAEGWYDPASGQAFNFATAYADLGLPKIQACQARFAMSQAGLGQLAKRGGIEIQEVFNLLRTHGAGDDDSDWRPGEDGDSTLCMHAKDAAGFETAASLVTELPRLGEDRPLVYWASLASPCLSAFVPVWFDDGAPAAFEQPALGLADAWWDQEKLQRAVERDYAAYSGMVRSVYGRLEREALAAVSALPAGTTSAERQALTAQFAARQDAARRALRTALDALAAGPLPPRPDLRGTYLADLHAEIPNAARHRAPLVCVSAA
ncbi:C69 family dipeptidase [Acidisoma silvae]|uniref:Dipeptidase n=1 Tax=Acidisoma silvae TaxID=2802396 RepID=A0A963YTX5_9PROT|nr:C69 family dipeptidase [Acidisoma silvae]MCB8876973.1 C69 family dipeptidase [Acidisoma silvae]